jgi:hypothetical protein
MSKSRVSDSEVVAWKVVFEDGSEELHLAKSLKGEPTFGRWITPLMAGETFDLDAEADTEKV